MTERASLARCLGVATVLAVVAVASAEDPRPKPLRFETKAAVCVVAASPDGRAVVAGAEDGSIRLLRCTDGSMETIEAGEREISRVGFTTNSRFVWATPAPDLSGSSKDALSVFRVASGRFVRRIEVDRSATEAVKIPIDGALIDVLPLAGDRLLLRRLWEPKVAAGGGLEDKRPEEVDLETGERTTSLVGLARTQPWAVTRDLSLVALDTTRGLGVARIGETGLLWESKASAPGGSSDAEERHLRYDGAAFSTDGTVVVACGIEAESESMLIVGGTPFLEVFDAITGKLRTAIRPKGTADEPDPVVGAAFVAVRVQKGADPALAVFDLTSGAPLRLPLLSGEKPVCACATHDGSALWIATDKGVVRRVAPEKPSGK